jgi:hypothetical protein
MIDFCLFPVSQVRALQYPGSSHAPPGAPALRIAWMLMLGPELWRTSGAMNIQPRN